MEKIMLLNLLKAVVQWCLRPKEAAEGSTIGEGFVLKKKHGGNIDNPSVQIYVNKIENRITFKINAWNN